MTKTKENLSDAQRFVLQTYPQATCFQSKVWLDKWLVTSQPDNCVRGIGDTAIEAWACAADRLTHKQKENSPA